VRLRKDFSRIRRDERLTIIVPIMKKERLTEEPRLMREGVKGY
jgi:hypothetical protein